MSRKRSFLTVTDQFCGAGGSSIGATESGLEVRLALNHWKLAIETHNTNFPNTDHDCTDISAADPRRYPSTDILITSPECTTHSPAGGTRRSQPQRDLFKPHAEDPATARSRATMWDVPRFAEYHQYRIIITENVVEVIKWPLFSTWLQAMDVLGYRHSIVSLNSMYCHPTPQSRDRVYIVLWKKGNRAPRLAHHFAAPCSRCERVRESYQAFKPGRTYGKYGRQYVYRCGACHTEVTPFYFASLNAIDLSLPGQRIGERTIALKDRTMERIRFGLQKYGRQSLIIRNNMTSGIGHRVKAAAEAPLPSQAASHWPMDGLFTVETSFVNSENRRPRGAEEPLPAQSARQSAALVRVPFTVPAGSNPGAPRSGTDSLAAQTGSDRQAVVLPFTLSTSNSKTKSRSTRAGHEPLATATTAEDRALVVGPHAIVPNRNHGRPRQGDDVLPGICTGGHQMLVSPSALITLRSAEDIAHHLGHPLPTQVASCTQDWLVSPTPFLASYYGTDNMRPVSDALASLVTVDRHGLVEPAGDLDIMDCFFRMLQPHEIGAGMAFPVSYTVLGNKRDQVKQYGNAVTPPAMKWLIQRCVESLAA